MELTGVRRIALPEVLTSFSASSLAAEIAGASQDDAITMLLIEGGSDVFCRGMDIDAIAAGAAEFGRGVQEFADTLCLLAETDKPTIAVVRGAALGGGLGLAAACDLVIAASSATFGLPEALFGLAPAVIAPVLLQRISTSQLRRMVLTAATLDAGQAQSIGLVDEVVDDAALTSRARKLMTAVSRVHAGTRRALAGIVQQHRSRSIRDSVQWGVTETTRAAGSTAVSERIRRFLEGDAPWQV